MANKFYITTAIAYTSRKPHIGNVYEIILTDAVARYHRLRGDDVYFLTGTDEHGQKIEQAASERGIPPQQYVDEIAGTVRGIWDLMDTTYDQFIRTTNLNHKAIVQKIFKKLYEQGDIYKSQYEGKYCVVCEAFYTDTQLVDGKCPDCGKEVTTTTEEAYFFKMSKYQDRLMQHIEANPDFIVPDSRKKEMVNNFLKPGLQDLCVSRTSFSWGVGVDFDPKHVVYVWIDALSNYITALGYDPDGSSELFKKYWPCDVHVIGKDILRFHTIYWPIILMALDIPLPKQIFGHPWVLFNNEKMSKSVGNVIYADELAEQFSTDAVRYFSLSEMPYGHDGNFNYQSFITRYNTDLANTLGNLVNRTVAMCNKYFDGEVANPNVTDAVDAELIACCEESRKRYCEMMDTFHLADAADAVINLARRSNKYIDETAPWALAKNTEDLPRLKTVMFNLVESIRHIAVMIQPFMPTTSAKIFEQIGCTKVDFDSLNNFGDNGITKVGEGTPLFNRIDEAKVMKELEDEFAAKHPPVQAPAEPAPQAVSEPVTGVCIGIEDFQKVSLTVAQVTDCEPVPKSDKLLRLQLDDGMGGRQVVSGIAQWYTPADLIGKKVIVVSNLKPVKLRGVESNGMILAADCSNGDVKVIFVDDAINNGAKIR